MRGYCSSGESAPSISNPLISACPTSNCRYCEGARRRLDSQVHRLKCHHLPFMLRACANNMESVPRVDQSVQKGMWRHGKHRLFKLRHRYATMNHSQGPAGRRRRAIGVLTGIFSKSLRYILIKTIQNLSRVRTQPLGIHLRRELKQDMPDLDALGEFIDRHTHLFVLTGAGCSTGSGIPDYRDGDGQWKRSPPIDSPTAPNPGWSFIGPVWP